MTPLYLVGIALYVLGFFYFTYFCLWADPETSKTADFWTDRVPKYVSLKLKGIIGSSNVERLGVLGEYMLQVIYLVVVLGAWSIIFAYAYPWVLKSQSVENYHRYVGYVVFLCCMTSWRYACNVSPGIITAQNLARYDHFPYDGFLFVPDRICSTAGIPKLARSKYDRFSKVHVARFDHFCGWLHNPIGEENYRFFLLFLLVHVGMCVYGTYIFACLFWGEILEKKLFEVTFFNKATGEEYPADWYIIFQYMFGKHFYMSGVFLLVSVMGLVLGGFLGYHIYLTSYGMTTNEAYKWGQVKKWHKHEMKRYREAIKKGMAIESSVSSDAPTDVVPDGDVSCTGATGESGEATEKTNEEKSTIIDPGPMPKNIYNQGLVENWKEVLYPRSLRKDATDKWKRWLKEQGAVVGNQQPKEEPKKPKAH